MADTLTPKQRSRQMALVRDKDTGPELVVRRIVHALGFRYRLHVRSLPGCPDLVLPRHRKIIFVHGCFWHQHRCKRGNRRPATNRKYWDAKLERNKQRDRKHRRELRRLGWRVLTIWECQTKASKAEWLEARLWEFLGEE
jgi:DNA mismatch endonuclease (patch repair protein)